MVNLDVNLGGYFTLCFVTVQVDNLDIYIYRGALCYFSYYQMHVNLVNLELHSIVGCMLL